MVFRMLGKRLGRFRLPDNTVTISKRGQVNFSHNLWKKFKGKEAVYVYIDLDYNKLAFAPTENLIKGYKIDNHGRSKIIQSAILSRAGIVGAFPARFTEGKVIVEKLKIKDTKGLIFVEE